GRNWRDRRDRRRLTARACAQRRQWARSAPLTEEAHRNRSIAMARGAASELRRPRQFVGKLLVEPPNLHETRGQAGEHLWLAVAIPVSDAHVRRVPLRHHELVPLQHAVERARGGDEI